MNVTASSLPSDPYSIPLDRIDMSQPGLFQQNLHGAYFARLGKEAPVHYCAASAFAPFWPVTKFEAIGYVDRNHEIFS